MIDPHHLREAWAGLEAPVGGIELATIEVELAPGRAVYVGRDSENRIHLLASASGQRAIRPDRSSRGVVLVGQPLEVDGHRRLFVDLVCVAADLQLVFEQLAVDICERITRTDESPATCIRAALGEWRDLLRGHGGGPEYGEVIGLRGELEVARRLALMDPESVVRAWTGPTGTVHDFQAGRTVIEVKTSTAQSGSAVRIHGLRQLDPPPEQDLYVWFFRIMEDDTSEGIQNVVEDLLRLNVSRDGLLALLEATGYEHEDPRGWEGSFRIESSAIWRIGESFPGLRESRIGAARVAGISDVSYVIELEAGGAPLEVRETERVLRLMADAAGG